MRDAVVTAVLLAVVAVRPLPASQQDASRFEGRWGGAIELPGSELGFEVDLRSAEGRWEGTIDIPMQGAMGLPLEGVAVDGPSITFAIAGVAGAPTFEGTREADGVIRGSFRQSGMVFTFRMRRDAKAAGSPRPQSPRPPFPYREEEVSITSGGVALAGTLTLPGGDRPCPAVVLVTGSGPQDRDETVFGHRPFAVLADHLARQGIAVLRWDDRGVGGSTGSTMESTAAELAGDVVAGITFLGGRTEIAPGRAGLLGHSEGAMVAALATAESGLPAFLILMAGTGVPLDEVIVRQTELISRVGGMDEEAIGEQRRLQAALLRGIVEDAPQASLVEAMRALVDHQLATVPEASRPSAEERAAIVRRQLAGIAGRWGRFALALDPRESLRLVTVPALVLSGSLDLQVDPEQNVPEILRALLEGGASDVTARVFTGLNHLFQPARTGAVGEYAAIETTIAPAVLEVISAWIRARTGGAGADEGGRTTAR